ncbi:separin protein [Dispira parvispora]|uniref:separase n=1 Tax=Dispira parvispora TaxID=1520584 RepID=A0A9W8ATQ5_9FUNG|nr:separin protein [Dispira parvispora]
MAIALLKLPTSLVAIDPNYVATLQNFIPNVSQPPEPHLSAKPVNRSKIPQGPSKPTGRRTVSTTKSIGEKKSLTTTTEITSRGHYAMKLVNFVLTQLSSYYKEKQQLLRSSTSQASAKPPLENWDHVVQTAALALDYLWCHETRLKLRPLDVAKVESNFITKLVQFRSYNSALKRLDHFCDRLLTNHGVSITERGLRNDTKPKGMLTKRVGQSNGVGKPDTQKTISAAHSDLPDNAITCQSRIENPPVLCYAPLTVLPNTTTLSLLLTTAMLNALRCLVELKDTERLRGSLPWLRKTNGTCYDWCQHLLSTEPTMAHGQIDTYFRLLHKAASLFPPTTDEFLAYKLLALQVFPACQQYSFSQYLELALYAGISVEKALTQSKPTKGTIGPGWENLDGFYGKVLDSCGDSVVDWTCPSLYKLVEHRLQARRKQPVSPGMDPLFGTLTKHITQTGEPILHHGVQAVYYLLELLECSSGLPSTEVTTRLADLVTNLDQVQVSIAPLFTRILKEGSPYGVDKLLPLLIRALELLRKAIGNILNRLESAHADSTPSSQDSPLVPILHGLTDPKGGLDKLIDILDRLTTSVVTTEAHQSSFKGYAARLAPLTTDLFGLYARLVQASGHPDHPTLTLALLEKGTAFGKAWRLVTNVHWLSSVGFNLGGALYRRRAYPMAIRAFSLCCDVMLWCQSHCHSSNAVDGDKTSSLPAFPFKPDQALKRFELLGVCQYAEDQFASASHSFARALGFLSQEKQQELVTEWAGDSQPLPTCRVPLSETSAYHLLERYVKSTLQGQRLDESYQSIHIVLQPIPHQLSQQCIVALLETELVLLRQRAVAFPTLTEQSQLLETLLTFYPFTEYPIRHVRTLIEQVKLNWAQSSHTQGTLYEESLESLHQQLKGSLDALKSSHSLEGDKSLTSARTHYLALGYSWLAILTGNSHPDESERLHTMSLKLWHHILTDLPLAGSVSTPVSQDIQNEVRSRLQHPGQLYHHLQFLGDLFSTQGSHLFHTLTAKLALRLLSLTHCPVAGASEALLYYACLGRAYLRLGNIHQAGQVLTRGFILSQMPSQASEHVLELLLVYVRFLSVTNNSKESLAVFQTASSVAQRLLQEGGSAPPDMSKESRGRPRPPSKPRTKKHDLVLLAKATLVYAEIQWRTGQWPLALEEGTRCFRLLSYAASALTRLHHGRNNSGLNSTSDSGDETVFTPDQNSPTSSLARLTVSTTNMPSKKDDQVWQKYAVLHHTSAWHLQSLFFDVLWFLGQGFTTQGFHKEADYFLKQAVSLAQAMNSLFYTTVSTAYQLGFVSRHHDWDRGQEILRHVSLRPENLAIQYGVPYRVNAALPLGDWYIRKSKYREAHQVYQISHQLLRDTGTFHDGEDIVKMCPLTPQTTRVAQLNSPALVSAQPKDSAVEIDGLVPAHDLGHQQAEIAHRLNYLSALTPSPLDNEEPPLGTPQRIDHWLLRAKSLWLSNLPTVLQHVDFSKYQAATLSLTACRKRPRLARGKKRPQRGPVEIQHLRTMYEALQKAIDLDRTFLHPHDVHQLVLMWASVAGLLAYSDPFGPYGEPLVVSRVIYELEMAKGVVARRLMASTLRKKYCGETHSQELAWPDNELDLGLSVNRGVDSGNSATSSSPLGSPTLDKPKLGLWRVPCTNLETDTFWESPERQSRLPVPSTDYFTQLEQSYLVGEDVSQFQATFVDTLPSNWSVCSLGVYPDQGELFLTRFDSGCSPLLVRLPLHRMDFRQNRPVTHGYQSMADEFQSIIRRNNETSASGKFCVSKDDKVKWWRERKSLDDQLRLLLHTIQSHWLGGFTGMFGDIRMVSSEAVSQLCVGLHTLVGSVAKGRCLTKIKAVEWGDLLKCILVLGNSATSSQLQDLAYFILDTYATYDVPVAYDDLDIQMVTNELQELLQRIAQEHPIPQSSGKPHHVVLILDKHLQLLPWESMPCLRQRSVSRLPSLHFLRDRVLLLRSSNEATNIDGDTSYIESGSGGLNQAMGTLSITGRPTQRKAGLRNGSKQTPWHAGTLDDDSNVTLTVNRKRVFYLLNPGQDLKHTQDMFEPVLRRQPGWDGIVGRVPMDKECEQALKSHDVYLYFGHSGGEQYLKGQKIRRFDRCAVSLLFGCSSGYLKPAGEFDPCGIALDYMVAGCPSLVANLWDVTDKDIDRFSKAVLEEWGLVPSSDQTKVGDSKDKGCSLSEAVARGRDECHLKYLIGAAPVVYGIPCYLD